MSKPWICSKTVIITGATGGIGKELTTLFIEKYGCTVIGVARNRERLSALEEKWQGSFTGVSCDASKMDEWLRLKGILDEKNISVDILINNAGILPEFKATTLTDLKECEGVMGINLFSAMYSFYALKDNVLKSKTPAIINVSSAAALSPLPGTALYSASKGGLRAYTLAMGKELGKKCYVGCVCPGFCDTEIFSAQSEAIPRPVLKLISTPPRKMAKKIVRGIIRRRRYMRIGVDAGLMDIIFRISPRMAMGLFSWVIKISGLKCFKKVFYKDN